MLFRPKKTTEVEVLEPATEKASSQDNIKSGLEKPTPERLIEELEQILEMPRPKGAVVKVYLENFRQFNDTFGFQYGEKLLGEIHEFLKTIPNGRVFRFGGVEFVLLLDGAGYGPVERAYTAVQERFESPWHLDGMDYMCSTSIGVVLYPGEAATVDQVVKGLEYAVAEAAAQGQNAVAMYDGKAREKVARRQRVAKLLDDALKNGGLDVRYRPTFNLEEKAFSRAECYLRIVASEMDVIGAAELLPVAEDSGLICQVNRFAIRKACEEIKALVQKNVPFESLAVLISPVQFLQEHFLDEMQEMLDEYGIPPKKLAFELSESVLVNSLNRVRVVMQELSEMGIEFVLNEFGTGYSGINNILDLPVDVVKLERMFVWQLETNPRSGCLIDGLIRIAHGLGLKLIAEGVETQNQVDRLAEYGCRYEQGFYYSATVEGSELQEILGKKREPVTA